MLVSPVRFWPSAPDFDPFVIVGHYFDPQWLSSRKSPLHRLGGRPLRFREDWPGWLEAGWRRTRGGNPKTRPPILRMVRRRVSSRIGAPSPFGALGQGFGFVDDPSLIIPPLGLVRSLPDQAHLLRAGLLALGDSLGQQVLGKRFETSVAGDSSRGKPSLLDRRGWDRRCYRSRGESAGRCHPCPIGSGRPLPEPTQAAGRWADPPGFPGCGGCARNPCANPRGNQQRRHGFRVHDQLRRAGASPHP